MKFFLTRSQNERRIPQWNELRTFLLILVEILPTSVLKLHEDLLTDNWTKRYSALVNEWTQTRRKESSGVSLLTNPPIVYPNRIPQPDHFLIMSKINLLISCNFSVHSSLAILVANFIFHCYCHCAQPISENKTSVLQALLHSAVITVRLKCYSYVRNEKGPGNFGWRA